MPAQNPNFPVLAWQAAWPSQPNSTSRAWYDLTPRVTAWTCQQGRQYELGQIQSGTAQLTVANKDEALTPANLVSPLNNLAVPAARQWNSNTSGTGTATSLGTVFGTTQAGNLLVLAANGNAPLSGPTGWTLAGSQTGNQYLSVWYRVADGTETAAVVTSATATTIAVAIVEYRNVGLVQPVDVTASATTTGSSITSQATGTTAATTSLTELLVCAVGPHNYAAASAPASPAWSGGVGLRINNATTNATASTNVAIILGDKAVTTTGTQTSTASWTNAAVDAGGLVVTFRAVKTLVPWRPIRCWGMWPLTGNILNTSNAQWMPSLPGAATFEDGTTGGWSTSNCTVSNSTAQAHDGTHSLLVTYATSASGAFVWQVLPPLKVGQTYTVSCWVYVPAGSPSVKIQMQGINSTGSSVTNAWQRLSLSWTVTDISPPSMFIGPAASTSGQSCYIDSIQVELGASASTFTTSGPTVYPIHTGFVERFPGTWTAQGYHGWQSLTTVDGLAALPKVTLQDCMTEDVQQDNPVVTFPLTDAAGTVIARAFLSPGYSLAQAEIGISSLFPTFGTAGGPGPDGFTYVTLTPQDSLNYWGLIAGVPPGISVADNGAGVSMEIWFRTSTHTIDQCVVCAVGFNAALEIRTNTSGNIYARVTNNAGSSYDYTITGSAFVCDNAWHHAVLTESNSVGGIVTATLYCDGASQGTATRSAGAAFQATQWWFGSQWWPFFTNPFAGGLARFAWYRQALSAARAQSHWLSGGGFPFDTPSQRIARVLGWMPWGGTTALPSTSTTVAPAKGYAGRTVTDVLQELTTTENGPLYANVAGALELVPRQAYYKQASPVWVFGENSAGGEYPYEGDFTVDEDPTYLANQVQVTAADGVVQNSNNAGSVQLYFPSSLQITTVHQIDVQASSMAQYMAWRYANPRTRVATISFRPAGNISLWPMILGAQFGDRVRVMRRTSTGQTYQLDCFIESIQHTVNPTSADYWVTTMQLSPVDPAQAGLIGDAAYGLIGTTAVIVY